MRLTRYPFHRPIRRSAPPCYGSRMADLCGDGYSASEARRRLDHALGTSTEPPEGADEDGETEEEE